MSKDLTPKAKPTLSFWEIWNMSFGFLGIQFGFALQNANVSRIFETLGANVEDIPILWVAAPLTGLIVQPIIGYFSDRTWNRLGRRRPYFLVGAILASLALFIMPNSPALWAAAGMLWIMDASINISMEPFRAFVGDNLPSHQRTTGFAMQSFFIGIGAVVASAMPYVLTNWFGVSNTAPEGIVPDSVKLSFYLGGAIFLIAVLWTVFRSREYPPEELEAFELAENKEVFHKDAQSPDSFYKNGSRQLRNGGIVLLIGSLLWWLLSKLHVEKEVFILAGGMLVLGMLLLTSGLLQRSGKYQNGFVTIINDFHDMPATMKQLAWVQFFSWFALFAMWIYTTSAVTSHIFGATDKASELYNQGANWVGICFAVYNGIAAVVAFLLP
ncbi:MAG TPA: MFS transporter, partial [Saprospiraceae bacterium]|nr:MFS transporter [Saprospiraceae bacterium]